MGTMRFGAKGKAAGTRTELTQADKGGTTSDFGKTLFVGAFEKGPVGRYFECSGLDTYRRVFGMPIPESQVNLAAEHFYIKAGGAGTFFGMRLTDGNERVATLPLFSRNVDTSYAPVRPAARLADLVALVKSANGGRWGGRAQVFGEKVSSVSGAISGSVFDTGLTGADWPFKHDELKGASFRLEGETKVWTIEGNDAAGLITVTGDFVGVTTTDGRWRVKLENTDDATNAPRGLALVVRNGVVDPEGEFDLVVVENKYVTRDPLAALSINPASPAYFETLVNEALEQSQHEVEVEDQFVGDVTREENLPANFAEIALAKTTNTVRFRVLNFVNPAAKNGYVGTLVNGGEMVPHVYKLTVKAGATGFTVEAWDITETYRLATNLPDGTFGVAYAAPHPFLSGFTATQGTSAYILADEIKAYVRPLPTNLAARGGYFYPNAFAATGSGSKDVTVKYRIYSNTFDTITLGVNQDITSVVTLPGAPAILGASAWDTTKDTTGKTFIYQLQGAGAVTVTLTGGASKTAEETRDEFNLAVGGGAGKVLASVRTAGGHKYLDFTADDGYVGPAATFKATTGTLNALAGVTDNTTSTGAVPTVGRLEFQQDFERGRDGLADLADAHYTEAWDTDESPLLDLNAEHIGCLKCAMPGVVSVVPNQAMLDYCKMYGHAPRVEVPSTILTETAARAYLRASYTWIDQAPCIFPSYGYLTTNPYGSAVKYLCTATGAVCGVEARYAGDAEGYQKAACDEGARIDPIFSSLPTDLPSGKAKPLDNNILNGFGFQELRHRGKAIFIWGDRTPGEGWVRAWKHEQECLLHLAHEFLMNGDQLAFKVSSGREAERTRNSAVRVARSILKPKWDAKGGPWFEGDTFEQACPVKCDKDNNPSEVSDAGDLVVSIPVKVVRTNENVTFKIGAAGVTF